MAQALLINVNNYPISLDRLFSQRKHLESQLLHQFSTVEAKTTRYLILNRAEQKQRKKLEQTLCQGQNYKKFVLLNVMNYESFNSSDVKR